MAETDTKPDTKPGDKKNGKLGEFFQKHKTAVIATGIIVAVVIFYLYFSSGGSSSASNSGLATSPGSQGSVTPSDLANALANIPQGPAGPAGPAGATGPQGKTGKRGRRGARGPAGKVKHHRKPKLVPPTNAIYHTVKPGDTFSGIAARNGVSEPGLRAVNGGITGAQIQPHVGQRLRVR